MTLRVSAGVSVLPSAANDRLPADLDDIQIQTVSWQVLSQLPLFEGSSGGHVVAFDHAGTRACVGIKPLVAISLELY
jgi:hypothetical protein